MNDIDKENEILSLKEEIKRLNKVNELLMDRVEDAQLGRETTGLFETNGLLRRKLEDKTNALSRAFKKLQNRQAQLIHASKLSSLGEMSAGIAHEINNPLTILLTQFYLMERLLEEPNPDLKKVFELTEKGKGTVLRISRIVEGMRSIWRDESDANNSETSCAKIIDLALDLGREKLKGEGVKLLFETNEFADTVFHCNSVQVSQVLINLLNNAFDAVKHTEAPWIRVECFQEGAYACIAVTDSGKGIEPEQAEKIFDPFFTTKEVGQGTGLGLSVSHNLIKRQGGEIRYDHSSPNTRFVVSLPIGQA